MSEYLRELVEIVAEIGRHVDGLQGDGGPVLSNRIEMLQTAMDERLSVEAIKRRRAAAAGTSE